MTRVPARPLLVSFLVVGFLLLGGCPGDPGDPAPDPPGEEAIEAAVAEAREAEQLLGETLMGRLREALDAGPPAEAVEVCSEAARAITRRAAEESGVAIGRTSLKLRNPENAPDEWERSVLEAWASGEREVERVVETTEGEEGRPVVRVMSPIHVMPLCTTCHGPTDEIDPSVREALAEPYPEDEARGYRPGDLRGAFTSRVPLD